MNTMRAFRVACVLASASAFVCASASAGPANPTVLQIQQPSGEKISTVLRGDEFQAWRETLDGYTIVKGPKDVYYYAQRAKDSEDLIPSTIVARPQIVTGAFNGPGLVPGQILQKHLRPKRNMDLQRLQGNFLLQQRTDWIKTLQRDAEYRDLGARPVLEILANRGDISGTWAPRAVLGQKKLLVVLVNFSDVKLRPDAVHYWNNAIFEPNGKTVARFYRENSYGKVTITPVPCSQPGGAPGVVTVTLNRKNPNYENQYTLATETPWINQALAAAAPYIDFAALDTDQDGTISVDEALVYFILAGYETSANTKLSPSVWAHRLGGDGVTVAGKNLSNWALNGEMYDAKTRMGVGIVTHEMGHAMGGLPDLYDITYQNVGLGGFSVMAYGSWGAQKDEMPSTTPVGLDAWSRQYLSWSTPRSPTNGSQMSLPSGLLQSDSAVLLANSKISTSEYWLVENRPQFNWDAGLYRFVGDAPDGLLILHIDTNVGTVEGNTFNAYEVGAHQGNVVVAPERSECNLVLPGDSLGCPSIFFGGPDSAVFDGLSIPTTAYYSGKPSGLGLKDISAKGATMTATVTMPTN